MSEYEGIVSAYIPQCAVYKFVDGAGCKAFLTKNRNRKYYDSRDDDFCKCPNFDINESSQQAGKFKQIVKFYKWKDNA